jgi:uncharacterized protein
MRVSIADGESAGNGRSVVLWIMLLCVITFVGALPLIVGGWNLDQLPSSSPLLPLVFTGIILTAYAPSLAALLVARFWHGKGGLRELIRQLATWRVGIAWYLLVLLGPIVLVLLANVMSILLGGAPPKQWLVVPSTFGFLGPLLAGSLGEELGWRGFALPRLQNRYGALWASIIIALLYLAAAIAVVLMTRTQTLSRPPRENR